MMAARRKARKQARRMQKSGSENMSSKSMRKAMNQLDLRDLTGVVKVVIELEDYEIIINKPEIQIMKHEGKDIYMVNSYESTKEYPNQTSPIQEKVVLKESDIQLVMKQAEVDKSVAEGALQISKGDLAKAVMSLRKT